MSLLEGRKTIQQTDRQTDRQTDTLTRLTDYLGIDESFVLDLDPYTEVLSKVVHTGSSQIHVLEDVTAYITILRYNGVYRNITI